MPTRVTGIVDYHFLAIDIYITGVGLIGAGEAFNQSGFAGAIVAQEPDHLARMKINADPIYRFDAAECDRDILQLDQRSA